MSFDYSKLRGRIREKYKTETAFAKAMKLSRPALSNKLNNLTEFTSTEIARATKLLDIRHKDIPAYFFKQEVRKYKQAN